MGLIRHRPTILAQWHEVVASAQFEIAASLPHQVEAYLVCLLMRYTDKPELANSFLSEEFLQALQSFKSLRDNRLQEVGDKCLLFSGLFPGIAERRRVSVSYFTELGQSAYQVLGELEASHDNLYLALTENFQQMQHVLDAMRAEEARIDYNNELQHFLQSGEVKKH